MYSGLDFSEGIIVLINIDIDSFLSVYLCCFLIKIGVLPRIYNKDLY